MIKNTKLRSKGVKRARELIYTAERQASRDVGLAGLRLKPGSSHCLKRAQKLSYIQGPLLLVDSSYYK
jgi:hypothetical protein